MYCRQVLTKCFSGFEVFSTCHTMETFNHNKTSLQMACEGGLCEEKSFTITTFEILPVGMTVTVSVVVIFVHEPFTTDVTRKLIGPSMVVDMHV